MSDLIVIDESYEEISSLYGEIGELLEERLNEYINMQMKMQFLNYHI
ncbi:hypothetical protein [Roseburia sp. 499]|nr:hypothetical protein [Roseburia sp. 499]WVK69813.1 hypothetical protein BIV20_15975 [Roseburia sp. 499]